MSVRTRFENEAKAYSQMAHRNGILFRNLPWDLWEKENRAEP